MFHLGIKVHPWYPNGGHLLAFALTAWIINEFENLHIVSCLICFPFKISVLWLWPSQSQLNNNNNIIIFISIQTFHWPFNSLSSDVNMYILLTALQIFLLSREYLSIERICLIIKTSSVISFDIHSLIDLCMFDLVVQW